MTRVEVRDDKERGKMHQQNTKIIIKIVRFFLLEHFLKKKDSIEIKKKIKNNLIKYEKLQERELQTRA